MSMTPAKVFREAIRDPTRSSAPNGSSTQHPEQKQIVSLAFDDTGRFCTVAGEDDYFTTFDVVSGRKHKYFASQKYGVDHVTPTHAAGNILHASTKENHDVRYHSAHDNKYLKYFRGHTGRFVQLFRLNFLADESVFVAESERSACIQRTTHS